MSLIIDIACSFDIRETKKKEKGKGTTISIQKGKFERPGLFVSRSQSCKVTVSKMGLNGNTSLLKNVYLFASSKNLRRTSDT